MSSTRPGRSLFDCGRAVGGFCFSPGAARTCDARSPLTATAGARAGSRDCIPPAAPAH
jgi:hypothetical protein